MHKITIIIRSTNSKFQCVLKMSIMNWNYLTREFLFQLLVTDEAIFAVISLFRTENILI